MTTLTQGIQTGEFLLSEASGMRSRSKKTVTVAGAVALPSGTVLGKISTGTSATSAAIGTNTGNGTMGAVTLTTVPTQAGAYALAYLTATTFRVTAPDGTTSDGVNGTAFSALGIGFTMTTGGTPMVAGDGFTITITPAIGKPTAASVANGGNTGNSTSSAVTTNGYAPMLGDYKLTIIEPGANVGTFALEDPNGKTIAHGVVATAFTAGGLSFTLADGSTDFVSGDQFVITVAAGSGKYVKHNVAAVNGSQFAAGVLYNPLPGTNADYDATVFERSCEVIGKMLNGGSNVTALAVAELAALGIIVR